MAVARTEILERKMRGLLAHIQEAPFRGAWRATAVVTGSVTVAAGLLMRLTDPDNFTTVWDGLWWAAQTVTTVGYGDDLPESAAGRVLAVLVMVLGVTFITVTSAAIASAFVDAASRRRAAERGAEASTTALAAEVRALAEEVRRLRADLAAADGAGDLPPPG
jgi:voltage-gated potassium channel